MRYETSILGLYIAVVMTILQMSALHYLIERHRLVGPETIAQPSPLEIDHLNSLA
jgi:hypothetical protein